MNQTTRLKYSAVFYGVFWTVFMAWWSDSYHPAHLAMLTVAGVLNALLWYWLMGKYFRWIESRRAQNGH